MAHPNRHDQHNHRMRRQQLQRYNDYFLKTPHMSRGRQRPATAKGLAGRERLVNVPNDLGRSRPPVPSGRPITVAGTVRRRRWPVVVLAVTMMAAAALTAWYLLEPEAATSLKLPFSSSAMTLVPVR